MAPETLNGWRCDAHEAMTDRISRIETTTNQTLQIVRGLDQRIYDSHGEIGRHGGYQASTIKILLVVASIGAAIGAIVSAIID